MTNSRLLGWLFFLFSVAIVLPSTLYFARNGLGLALSDFFDQLVNWVDDELAKVLRPLVESWLKPAFQWLREQFGLPLHLQPHWRHVFVVLWLLFGAYGKATTPSFLGWIASLKFWSALTCALVAAIAAGTVALTGFGVVLFPLAGFYTFLWLNGLGLQGTNYLYGAVFLSGFGIVTAFLVPSGFPLLSNLAPSVPLLGLAFAVVIFALYLLFLGMPGHEAAEGTWLERRVANPGTRIAGIVLTPVVLAAFVTWRSDLSPDQMRQFEPARDFGDGTFQDCEDCPRMVKIPAGEFRMGSDETEVAWATKLGAPKGFVARETPTRIVRVGAFALGATEVTRRQFEVFLKEAHHDVSGHCTGWGGAVTTTGAGWSSLEPGFHQDADHPAVCVTHWDAVKYAEWLSRKTGHRYRLPTEAEWEYAARAGTTTSRYWGQGNEDACQYANVFDASAAAFFRSDAKHESMVFPCDDGYAFTAPVRKYKPNAFGLYDMLGNAWEWTLDCYRVNYNGAPSEVSISWAESCGGFNFSELVGLRVFRGGGWYSGPWRVRSTNRGRQNATERNFSAGFRVARVD